MIGPAILSNEIEYALINRLCTRVTTFCPIRGFGVGFDYRAWAHGFEGRWRVRLGSWREWNSQRHIGGSVKHLDSGCRCATGLTCWNPAGRYRVWWSSSVFPIPRTWVGGGRLQLFRTTLTFLFSEVKVGGQHGTPREKMRGIAAINIRAST